MSKFEEGVKFAKGKIDDIGLRDAKKTLMFFVENSIDFGEYDDFDRGIQSELKRRYLDKSERESV